MKTLRSSTSRNWFVFLRRLPCLFFGFFLFALGLVANLHSNLGMHPWGVLHVGIANVTFLTIGQAGQLIGLIVIIIGWLLGFAPGIGTLANMYFIGLFIDLIIEWKIVPIQTEPIGQLGQLLLSIVLVGAASLLYLRVELGAGPRDGLMMGLVKKLDKPVAYVRGTIELTACILGYFLGGPLGIGTLVTALTVGYSIQFFFKLGRFDSKSEQMNLFQLYRFLKNDKTHTDRT